ncbi:MAG: hypothetical protein ACK4PR_05090, partial [Gammaproteobacteria bacterium]
QLRIKSVGLNTGVISVALSNYLNWLLNQSIQVRIENTILTIPVPDSTMENTLLLWVLLALLPECLICETLHFAAMDHFIWKQILATCAPIKKVVIDNSKDFFSSPYFNNFHSINFGFNFVCYNYEYIGISCFAELDNNRIVCGTDYGGIRIFNFQKGQYEQTLRKDYVRNYGRTMINLIVLQDKRIVGITNHKYLEVWRSFNGYCTPSPYILNQETCQAVLNYVPNREAFQAVLNSERIITTGSAGCRFIIHDLQHNSSMPVGNLSDSEKITKLVILTDDQIIMVINDLLGNENDKLEIWNLKTLTCEQTISDVFKRIS